MIISSAIVWLVVGITLLLTELLATSVVAVFLGLGALAVAAALYVGLIVTPASQLWLFSLVSVVSLLIARKKLKQLFVGVSHTKHQPSNFLPESLGQTVVVLADFQQGRGRVELNGVHWSAVSQDELHQGQLAYIVQNDGILLHLSAKQPN